MQVLVWYTHHDLLIYSAFIIWCILTYIEVREWPFPFQRTILRVFLWIMGLMACFGNLIVIVWRLVGTNRNVSDIIITNLAVSDMLMGIYMICIASVDIHYR